MVYMDYKGQRVRLAAIMRSVNGEVPDVYYQHDTYARGHDKATEFSNVTMESPDEAPIVASITKWAV